MDEKYKAHNIKHIYFDQLIRDAVELNVLYSNFSYTDNKLKMLSDSGIEKDATNQNIS